MRANEFTSLKNIAFVKFEFEKALNKLIRKAKKQHKIKQSEINSAKIQQHNDKINALKITHKPTLSSVIKNSRPKR